MESSVLRVDGIESEGNLVSVKEPMWSEKEE